MAKHYYVEIKVGTRWVLKGIYTRQTDAFHFVKETAGEKYPMRVIRVIRSVVFNGEK